jgi:hypothetical protein
MSRGGAFDVRDGRSADDMLDPVWTRLPCSFDEVRRNRNVGGGRPSSPRVSMCVRRVSARLANIGLLAGSLRTSCRGFQRENGYLSRFPGRLTR